VRKKVYQYFRNYLPHQAFRKGWILPDGEFVPVALHADYIVENRKMLKRKFGVDLSGVEKAAHPETAIRLRALDCGFVRVNYEVRNGTLTIEAKKKFWRAALLKSVVAFLTEIIDLIDNLRVTLFLDHRTVDTKFARLFIYDRKEEKLQHLLRLVAPLCDHRVRRSAA